MNLIMTAAGPALLILAAMALATILLFVLRWMELRRAQAGCGDFLSGVCNVLGRGNAAEALALCEDAPSSVGRIAAAAIRNRSASGETRRLAVDAVGRSETARLDRRISALAAFGQIAPLLGLVGAFCSFTHLACALGRGATVVRADLVAGLVPGLYCATAGLAVAVLAHVAYALLRARLDRLAIDLEAAGLEILVFVAGRAEATEGARP